MHVKIFNLCMFVGWAMFLAGGVLLNPGWGLLSAGALLIVLCVVGAYIGGVYAPKPKADA
jgi:hypothetical protein